MYLERMSDILPTARQLSVTRDTAAAVRIAVTRLCWIMHKLGAAREWESHCASVRPN